MCEPASAVADCSRAGVSYTTARRVLRPRFVADCSQAGIDYTACQVMQNWELVADCSQAGIDYTPLIVAAGAD